MDYAQLTRDLDKFREFASQLCQDLEALSPQERTILGESYPETRLLPAHIQTLYSGAIPPDFQAASLHQLIVENQHLKNLLDAIYAARPPGLLEAEENLRASGIDVVGAVPWGTHFCQFYNTSLDLIETLVPYFRAGLVANEYCIWVTSIPLQVEEAIAAIRLAVPDLDVYLDRGQIEFLDYSEWYIRSGQFDADQVLQGWTEKLAAARERGFEGLRLTGNTFWLEEAHWADFTLYEEKINDIIGTQRMIALCTYSLEKCGVREILDVVANHQFALIKTGGRWEIIESAEHGKIEHALRVSEERLRLALWAAEQGVFEWEVRTDLAVWENRRMYEIFGLSPQDSALSLSQMKRDAIYPDDVATFETALAEGMLPGRLFHTTCRIRRMNDEELRWVEFSGNFERDAQGNPVKLIGVLCDITERKNADEEIRQNREWLQVTLTSIGDGVIAADTACRVSFLNAAAANLTGWTLEEVLGRPVQQVLPVLDEQSGQPAEDITARVLKEKRVVLMGDHITLAARDGRQIPIEDSAAPILDAQGNTTGVVLVFHDVTEKRRVNAVLHESEERYHNLFTRMNEGFALHELICDSEGKPVDYRFLDVNPAFEQFTGLTRETVVGRTVLEVMPNTESYWIETYGEVALTGKPRHFQNYAQSLDRYYDVIAYCPQPGHFAVLFIDVTEHRRMQSQAREAAARIEMHHRLIEQRERERLEIARDLHDGPVQELSAINFALQALSGGCSDQKVIEEISGIRQSLVEQIHELRAFSHELRSPVLAKFGLEKAIRAHLDSFNQKQPHMTIHFEGQHDGQQLPETIQLALYRIYQEALNNIVKHAQASQVEIFLKQDNGQVLLTIQDNGVGFQPPEDWLGLTQQGHLGLVGIHERAEAVGGSIKITSAPNQGTRLSVSVAIPDR